MAEGHTPPHRVRGLWPGSTEQSGASCDQPPTAHRPVFPTCIRHLIPTLAMPASPPTSDSTVPGARSFARLPQMDSGPRRRIYLLPKLHSVVGIKKRLRKPGVSFARGAKKPRRALPASKKLGPLEPRTWPAFWTCEMASSAHVARRLHMEAGKVESVGGPRIQQAMLPPKPPQQPLPAPRGAF